MCGICCELEYSSSNNEDRKHLSHLALLQRRGPNKTTKQKCGKLTLVGSVLWQQGAATCAQPLKCKNVQLLFNGDIFSIENCKANDQSDTEWLANRIADCENDAELIRFFRTLEGPYSIIFYNETTNALFFARDSLGRNSLLVDKHANGMRLDSVSYNEGYQPDKKIMELPPLGLFKIGNIQQNKLANDWTLYAWGAELLQQAEFVMNLETIETQLSVHITLSTPINCTWLREHCDTEMEYNFYKLVSKNEKLPREDLLEFLIQDLEIKKSIHCFGKLLESSVCNRVQKTTKQCQLCLRENVENCQHAKVAILFSGGIDCSILALLAHKYVPEDDQIDLINVAFAPINAAKNDDSYKVNAPDRVSARSSYNELLHLCPERYFSQTL